MIVIYDKDNDCVKGWAGDDFQVSDDTRYKCIRIDDAEYQTLSDEADALDIADTTAFHYVTSDINGNLSITSRAKTDSELIDMYKTNLANTDYQAIKFAEGELTEEEFAPMREQRRQWRARINELENGLNSTAV